MQQVDTYKETLKANILRNECFTFYVISKGKKTFQCLSLGARGNVGQTKETKNVSVDIRLINQVILKFCKY